MNDPTMMPAPWWYYVGAIVVAVLGVWLSAAVLRKAGYSPWWSLLFLVPIIYLFGMWLFAFARWPRIDRISVTAPSDYEGGWNVPPRRQDDDRR